jgi:hypothetical protein
MTKEWHLDALKKLYPHLDLDAEFCDATAWCMLHNRSLTSAFFLNWIAKCDEKFADTKTFQPIKKEKWPAPAARCWCSRRLRIFLLLHSKKCSSPMFSQGRISQIGARLT